MRSQTFLKSQSGMARLETEVTLESIVTMWIPKLSVIPIRTILEV